jgi:hypothetical protein
MYAVSRWLKQDTDQPLLSFFYGYCLLISCSSYFQFSTIYSFLLLYGPLIMMILVLVHQRLLQHNFITLRKIITNHHKSSDWINILVRACLKASAAGKSVFCIIEQSDSLEHLISSSCILKAPINEEVLTILLESAAYDDEKMMLINKNGILCAINATWRQPNQIILQTDTLKNSDSLMATALMATKNTDTLVILSSAQRHCFDIIAHGKMVENISASQAIRIMKHYLHVPSEGHKEKGDYHELYFDKKPFGKQPYS